MALTPSRGGYGGSNQDYGNGGFAPDGKTGGAGANDISYGGGATGGVGGAGGVNGLLTTGQTTVGTTPVGGVGGDGGAGNYGYIGGTGGGGGGAGGEGAYGAGTFTLTVTGSATGGVGGAGGLGGSSYRNGGNGGQGGSGGDGLFVGGGSVSVSASGSISGGQGGVGGAGGTDPYNENGAAGPQGIGGAGVVFASGAGTLSVASGGLVRGGDSDYRGGDGVDAGGALTVANAADILGGTGAYGVLGYSTVEVTSNTGRIVGGYTGLEARDALTLTNDGLVASGSLTETDTSGSGAPSALYTAGGTDGVRALLGGLITNHAAGSIQGGGGSAIFTEGDGQTLTVNNAGQIVGLNQGVFTYGPGDTGETLVVDNMSGALIQGGSSGYGVFHGGMGDTTLTNAGTITSGLGVQLVTGTVSNSGAITATDTAGGVGVAFTDDGTVSSNTGTIAGGQFGVHLSLTGDVTTGGANAAVTASTGAAVQFDQGGALVNQTGGLIRGGTDAADGDGVQGQGATGLAVTNAGTIRTGGSGGNGGRYGVSFEGTGATQDGTGALPPAVDSSLYNSGTISAPNVAAVHAGAGGMVTVVNTGMITGTGAQAVLFDQGGLTLTNGFASNSTTGHVTDNATGAYAITASVAGLVFNNYGIISGKAGAFSLSGSADLHASLYAGSTTGKMTLGAAADTVAIYTGATTTTADTVADPTGGSAAIVVRPAGTYAQAFVAGIDFGAGSNVLVLRGAGDGTAANGAAGTLNFTNAAIYATGGSFALNKLDAGTWTLSGATPSTLTGATSVTGGVLALDATGWRSALFVATGATLRGTGTGNAAVNIVGGSFAPGDLTGAFTSMSLSMTSSMAAPGGAATASVFSVTATGASSFGRAVVSGDSSAAATSATAPSAYVALSGTLSFTYMGGSEAAGTVYRIIDNQSSQAISGTFSNAAEGATLTSGGRVFKVSYVGGTGNDVTLTDMTVDSLTVAAGTTTTISTVQTYTGKTQISGELDLASGGSIASSSQVALKASGAVFDVSGAGAGGATVTIQELSGVAGSAIRLGAGVLSVSETASAAFAGVIGGTGGLVVNGSAPLTLTGANTFTGKTQVLGELDLAAGGSVASSSQVALKASGAVFDVSGAGANGATVAIKQLSGVAGSTIGLGSGVLSLNETVAATYAGAIADGGVLGGTGGGLVVNGTAPLTLTGVDTFTGKTQIYGQLNLAGSAVLNQSKAVTLKASAAVLDISGATGKEAIVNLAGVAGSHIYLGANTLKINETTAATFSGVIAAGGVAGGTGGGLIVKGTATLALTGANTFTGGVTLQGGTLELGTTTAAGVGHALTFAGSATLQLDSGALGGSGAQRSYGTAIAGFAASDHIDLASLAYASGATATYNGSTLTVTSGGTQVALTLAGPAAGSTFSAADDGHGHVLVGLVGGG